MAEITPKKSRLTLFNDHYFYSPLINHDSIIVDLGAHIGEFSRQISNSFGSKCYAVEALPTLYSQIIENHLIKKFNYAITRFNGPVTLYIAKTHGVSSVNKTIPEGSGIVASIVVEGINIESFLQTNAITFIDLLKVDIEGSEIDLFNSISDKALSKIKQITVEFHDFIKEFDCAKEIKQIKKRLISLGFFCIVFSRPYGSHLNVLFINKKQCKISNLEWLHFYIIEYIILRVKYLIYKIKYAREFIGIIKRMIMPKRIP